MFDSCISGTDFHDIKLTYKSIPIDTSRVGPLAYFMLLRQEAPATTYNTTSSMVGYSTDPSKCRFEFHTGGGDANSTLCQ
jgi:hypothetical protein